MSQFDIKTRKPVVATKKSVAVEVEAGKDYYWCTCGLSKNQPFCDGSHKSIGDDAGPMKWTAEETKKVYFCGCKQTGNAPMCDGSHRNLPDRVEVGDQWDAVKGDFKLSYFDLHGAAELIRVILKMNGVPFEEVRFPVKGDFLSEEQRAMCTGNTDLEWANEKANMPYGKMPVLEFKGVKIAESHAIARFLANRFGINGDNDLEAALIDATCETLRDVSTNFYKFFGLPKDEQAAYREKFVGDLKTHFALVEKQLQANGGKFLVGSRFSVADLTVWRLASVFGPWDKVKPQLPEGIAALVEAVAAEPKIAKYLEDREPRQFPLNFLIL